MNKSNAFDLTNVGSKENPKYQDGIFKIIFKDNDVQIDVLNSLFPGYYYKGMTLKNIEITNNFVVRPVNDVCFCARDKMILLLEHQSSLNPNMPLRSLIYLAEEYQAYILDSEKGWKSILSRTQFKVLRPEMFVIYTGDDHLCSKEMRLKDAFFDIGDGIVDRNKLDFTLPVFSSELDVGGALGDYIRLIKDYKALRKTSDPKIAARTILNKWSNNNSVISNVVRREMNTMIQELSDEAFRQAEMEEREERGREQGIEQGIERG